MGTEEKETWFTGLSRRLIEVEIDSLLGPWVVTLAWNVYFPGAFGLPRVEFATAVFSYILYRAVRAALR